MYITIFFKLLGRVLYSSVFLFHSRTVANRAVVLPIAKMVTPVVPVGPLEGSAIGIPPTCTKTAREVVTSVEHKMTSESSLS